MARKRSGGREKTLSERQNYDRRLTTRESSTTAGSAFPGTGLPPDSTASGASVDRPLDLPPGGRGARARRRGRFGLSAIAEAVLAGIGAVTLLGGSILYIESIRSRVAVVETKVDTFGKVQDSQESAVRREVGRLDNLIEKIEKKVNDLFGALRETSGGGKSRGDADSKKGGNR